MTMRCECTGCGEDCSHAYGTFNGDPYHFSCLPAKQHRRRCADCRAALTPENAFGRDDGMFCDGCLEKRVDAA